MSDVKAYSGDLGEGRQIYVQNQGSQTLVTLSSQSLGQQSQTSRFTTGEWRTPPTLFRSASGWMLCVDAAQGQQWLAVQPGGMKISPDAPLLATAHPLQPIDALPDSLTPLPPLKPLRDSVEMSPMRMQMGEMVMQMGSRPSAQSDSETVPPSDSPSLRSFCAQCGASAAATDRFCVRCGHHLDAGS